MEAENDSPPTPRYAPISRVPSYIQFAPKRAMASFENLVALANYEERLREARKIVWRDKGEKPAEMDDLWECAEHAGRGAMRAGSIAFAIRSGVSLILLMARIKKVPKSHRFALVRHALFGPDSWRFAAMIGTFVGLYKFILNALPIILPQPAPPPRSRSKQARSRSQFRAQHRMLITGAHEDALVDDLEVGDDPRGRALAERGARLSMSAQAHQVWVRKKTRRWYAIASGAIAGGLAIFWEKKGRRVGIAQQMFVRGLQGSYNAFSHKRGFRIPHGDVIVFSLCCGQILYAFLLRPDTLDKGYVNWIQDAGKIPRECVSMNRDLVRDRMFKLSEIDNVLAREDLTTSNRIGLLRRRELAMLSPPIFEPFYGPCEAVHPPLNSCLSVPYDRFFAVFRWMLPIYGALHFIPMLLFKRKIVMKDPANMLLRATWGTARSSAFLGVFVVIYQSFFCFKHNAWSYLMALRSSSSRSILANIARLIPRPLIDFLISKPSFFLGGLLCGLSLFVEEKRRRAELAMYVLPKSLESAWVMARGKGLVFGTGQYGDVLLTAIGMGMVMNTYQNDPQHLSGLVRRILYQFIGPN